MNKSSNIVGSPCPREIRSVSAGWSSYVAFKARFAALEDTNRAGRHINADATLRIKCGQPHLKLEICTSGSVRGEGGNILTYSARPRKSCARLVLRMDSGKARKSSPSSARMSKA